MSAPRYLEVTFRQGRALAAYLYLPRRPGDKSTRCQQLPGGLVVDYAPDGRPIGIEITSPSTLDLTALNAALAGASQQPVTHEEIAPLRAA